MAPHSSTLAWKILWTEEPSRLQSMGSLRVRQDWATSLSLFTFMHWRRNWQPTPVVLPGESQGRGAWWAAIYGVTQSQTRLKRLSSSSSTSSQIRGSSTPSAKTRPGADCGSDHELFIAKFKLKLKKVRKTIRPFRYGLNQIIYDYTVEVRNRFKGLDLIECLKNYGQRFVTLYRRQWSRPYPRKRNAKRQNGCLRRPYK